MTRHQRSRRMRATHPHQMTLALDWSAAEVAARAHLRVLPPFVHVPEPQVPIAMREHLRKAA